MKKTLVVVGSGASKDFCRVFPTGAELFKEINYHFLTELKHPPVREVYGKFLSPMMNEIQRIFPQIQNNLLVKVKNQIWNLQVGYEHGEMRDKSDLTAPSVDRFISEAIGKGELDSKAAELMKYAIAYLIKGAETAVVESERGDVDNWMKHLLTGLVELDMREVNEMLRIVTFNYDRTLERAVEMYASQSGFAVDNVLSHVYGSLGSLKDFPFDMNNDATELMGVHYRSIQLIGEERTARAFNHGDFEQVHFVGFGFDVENMKILGLPQHAGSRMRGTGYHMGDERIRALREQLRVEIAQNMECIEYVDRVLLPSLIE